MDIKTLKRKHRDLGNRIEELRDVHGDLGVGINEESLEMAQDYVRELKADL